MLPGMISVSTVFRKCIAGFKDHVLLESMLPGMIQEPICLESILPGMISGSSILRKYIAWYDFRILCHQKVET